MTTSRRASARDRVLHLLASGGTAPANLGDRLPDIAAASLRKAVRSLRAEGAIRVDAHGHLLVAKASPRRVRPVREALDGTDPDPDRTASVDAPAPLQEVTAVLAEGGLWRVGDIRERSGFGAPGIHRALARLGARGYAVHVARGQWRLASADCDLARDGRTLTVRILGALLDGQVRSIADLPSAGATIQTLHATVKGMRASGLLVGPRRGCVACCPRVRAELLRRLAAIEPGGRARQGVGDATGPSLTVRS